MDYRFAWLAWMVSIWMGIKDEQSDNPFKPDEFLGYLQKFITEGTIKEEERHASPDEVARMVKRGSYR